MVTPLLVGGLLRPSTLRGFCMRAGIRPEKSSGQNFLISATALEHIVAAVDPKPGDTILEVGAGFGVLTLALAERLKNDERKNGEQDGRIIAIERDRRVVPILREIVNEYGNVEVVEGDVLRFFQFILSPDGRSGRRVSRSGNEVQWSSIATHIGEMLRRSSPQHKLKIAANLPYSITSDFLRLLFDRIADGSLPVPERVVLLLQKEVVNRLIADPGRSSDRGAVGILTMLAQLHCAPRRIARVPPGSFWPPPKVESAVVVLEGWRTPEEMTKLLGGTSRTEFLHLLHAAFARRRGQLLGILRRYMKRSHEDVERLLGALCIVPTARPETLSLRKWIALAKALQAQ